MNEEQCFVCHGPYHPDTGGLHWVEYTHRYVPWCGVCEKNFVEWLVEHQRAFRRKMKINGKRVAVDFYAVNYPPKEETHGSTRTGSEKEENRDHR